MVFGPIHFSWTYTGFEKSLKNKNFDVSFADYGKYNATTFDPLAIDKKGNYGIDAIRNTTKSALEKYENNSDQSNERHQSSLSDFPK